MSRQYTSLGVVALAAAVGLVGYQVVGETQRQSQPQQPPSMAIGLDATEGQIKQAVAGARAGRKLTPKTWPNGARVAVAVSFDIDNELLARTNPLPVPLSQGE
jgi:hypothetical protein